MKRSDDRHPLIHRGRRRAVSGGSRHQDPAPPSIMTVIRDAGPPLPAPTLQAAMSAVRARGLRLSAARRLVLEALFAADDPVDAERIAGGLDGQLPSSDLASVYRNLETLEALGLVRHLHMGHGPGRYALTEAREREYVSCERCGVYVTLAPEELDGVRAAVHEACGYTARFTHFPVVGLCPDCASDEA
jgi:Fur family ferric uptake transcriptional regulator